MNADNIHASWAGVWLFRLSGWLAGVLMSGVARARRVTTAWPWTKNPCLILWPNKHMQRTLLQSRPFSFLLKQTTTNINNRVKNAFKIKGAVEEREEVE